jgi:hypothetical protein
MGWMNTRFKRADQERPHEQAGSEPATALGPAFVTRASVSWLAAAVGRGMICERQAAWEAVTFY